ncbi:MAG: mycofactocin-coupled SDR family oxidoreductase [Deltaproteobacteria bacterium]|nr:mycofactocin-coupled SDR family oxidoreductase [Deltaproteobacteria bacterium]
MRLKEQVAVVTGGARGNGFAIARALASEGANIVLGDICKDISTVPYRLSSVEDLDRAVKELSEFGVKVLGLRCDVRSAADVESLVAKTLSTFGRIDIAVANAGITSLVATVEMDETTWDDTLDTHLKGTFLLAHYAVPHMIEAHSGKFVAISSVGGQRGFGLGSHYCAAKHGILGFTKSLAMEVADHNVNVNAVCPGTVWTKMMQGLAEHFGMEQDEAKEQFCEGHLFKDREITPDDVARAVLWLCLPESRCVTGNLITVDSGWTAAAG